MTLSQGSHCLKTLNPFHDSFLIEKNRLECYIALDYKGLLGKNTLAYWTKKIILCF